MALFNKKFYQNLLEKRSINISKENVCYVGDALQDKETAINAKVDAILLDRHHEYWNLIHR